MANFVGVRANLWVADHPNAGSAQGAAKTNLWLDLLMSNGRIYSFELLPTSKELHPKENPKDASLDKIALLPAPLRGKLNTNDIAQIILRNSGPNGVLLDAVTIMSVVSKPSGAYMYWGLTNYIQFSRTQWMENDPERPHPAGYSLEVSVNEP